MGDMNQDPSMEEILASIKRVIAEDGRNSAGAGRPARRPPGGGSPAPPAPPPEDVLELDDPVREGEGGGEETLVSENAATASRQALAALAAMRQGAEPAVARPGEGALEAVVRDMLRPILKEWLDQHLPEIVEELVTREISRITGRPL